MDQELEMIQNCFKQINCYGEENICFSCQPPKSFFGMLGKKTNYPFLQHRKIKGYILNNFEKGICLIPIVVESKKHTRFDIENYVLFSHEEIETVTFKTEDYSYIIIDILLKDENKIRLKTPNRVKPHLYHEENVYAFIQKYK